MQCRSLFGSNLRPTTRTLLSVEQLLAGSRWAPAGSVRVSVLDTSTHAGMQASLDVCSFKFGTGLLASIPLLPKPAGDSLPTILPTLLFDPHYIVFKTEAGGIKRVLSLP